MLQLASEHGLQYVLKRRQPIHSQGLLLWSDLYPHTFSNFTQLAFHNLLSRCVDLDGHVRTLVMVVAVR